MTRISSTNLKVTSKDADRIHLLLGVDTRFTGADLDEGRSAAARFSMSCVIWGGRVRAR